jgi:hypothetical protein
MESEWVGSKTRPWAWIIPPNLLTLAKWLFRRPTEVEIGWGMLDKARDPVEIVEAGKRLANQGIAGAVWLSLVDPEPGLYAHPPWGLRSGLERVGLLDQDLEPKEYVEFWLKEIRTSEPRDGRADFIDISPEEYVDDPQAHLPRLWNHFREST